MQQQQPSTGSCFHNFRLGAHSLTVHRTHRHKHWAACITLNGCDSLYISDANNSLYLFAFCLIQFAGLEFCFLFFRSRCHLSSYSILANNKFMNIIYGQRTFLCGACILPDFGCGTLCLYNYSVFSCMQRVSIVIAMRVRILVWFYMQTKVHNNQ